jgi:toxin ParE1/3/4
MPSYRLSRTCHYDLNQVYLYSFDKFGEMQADAYASELIACFQLLAEQPRLGRVRPGKEENLRVYFRGSHIIAYRIVSTGVLIQRVLDGRRNWQRILRQY